FSQRCLERSNLTITLKLCYATTEVSMTGYCKEDKKHMDSRQPYQQPQQPYDYYQQSQPAPGYPPQPAPGYPPQPAPGYPPQPGYPPGALMTPVEPGRG